MNIELTPAQKKYFEAKHYAAKNAKEKDRLRAILFASEGWSVTEIAQALRIHETSARKYLKDFAKHNKTNDARGGSDKKLTDEQAEIITLHLQNVLYHDTRQIIELIENLFAVTYTRSGVTNWLHEQGFTYKKPKGTPKKVNVQAQTDFIQYYESLKKQGDPIFFIDAVHPTMATKISGGWIKKGEDKALQTNGSRTRLNIYGAVNLNDIGNAIIQKFKTIDSESVVSFFEHIRNASHLSLDKKIHVILDGAGYHKTDAVSEAADQLNIELHFLPSYSPNLNPIERLWKVMNEHVRNNQYFAKKKDFEHAIMGFFSRTLPKIGDTLSTRINDNFQVLKPAF